MGSAEIGIGVEVLRERILRTLVSSGVPGVSVRTEHDEDGKPEPGSFAITSEIGSLKLYLSADMVERYSGDESVRTKVDESLQGLVQLLKRR
jgi:hypothetical protein